MSEMRDELIEQGELELFVMPDEVQRTRSKLSNAVRHLRLPYRTVWDSSRWVFRAYLAEARGDSVPAQVDDANAAAELAARARLFVERARVEAYASEHGAARGMGDVAAR
jgi:hypothetical protein